MRWNTAASDWANTVSIYTPGIQLTIGLVHTCVAIVAILTDSCCLHAMTIASEMCYLLRLAPWCRCWSSFLFICLFIDWLIDQSINWLIVNYLFIPSCFVYLSSLLVSCLVICYILFIYSFIFLFSGFQCLHVQVYCHSAILSWRLPSELHALCHSQSCLPLR